MESGAAAFPLPSWHPHVYAQPPKSPTPHSIAHILGIRDDGPKAAAADQPLNLSCSGRPSPPGLQAVSPRAAHDAKTAPSPLPALGTPSLPHTDAAQLAALPRGEPLRKRAQHAAAPWRLPAVPLLRRTRARARAHNRWPRPAPPSLQPPAPTTTL